MIPFLSLALDFLSSIIIVNTRMLHEKNAFYSLQRFSLRHFAHWQDSLRKKDWGFGVGVGWGARFSIDAGGTVAVHRYE
jgi:hypothetical protein